MFLDDETKQELILPWTLIAGDVNNIVAVAGNNMKFNCPASGVLRRLQISAAAATSGTQFVLKLIRNSAGTPTTLVTLTSAVPYVVGTIVDSGLVRIPLYAGEPLNLQLSGTDADTDDLFSVLCIASVQISQASTD